MIEQIFKNDIFNQIRDFNSIVYWQFCLNKLTNLQNQKSIAIATWTECFDALMNKIEQIMH